MFPLAPGGRGARVRLVADVVTQSTHLQSEKRPKVWMISNAVTYE